MLSDILLALVVLEVAGVLWCLRPVLRAGGRDLAALPPGPPPAPPGTPITTPSPGLSLHCGHTHTESRLDKYGLSHCPTCAADRPNRFN